MITRLHEALLKQMERTEVTNREIKLIKKKKQNTFRISLVVCG